MFMTSLEPTFVKDASQLKGLVFAEKTVSVNAVKDALGELKGLFGGERAEYADEFAAARDLALEELASRAKKLDANSIWGLTLNFCPMTKQDAVFITASIYGTAAKITGLPS